MQLCVALDLESKEQNLKLAHSLKDFPIWLKVGLRSYIRDGEPFLMELKSINPSFKIFLDLKLYDIPNTMADAAQCIADLGVDMFNIHASAGKKAMIEVKKRISKSKHQPLILAVTALTSFSNDEFIDVYTKPIELLATKFAKDAYECGLDGVVSSAYESLDIKKSTSSSFITLTPGIRPFGEESGDQQRVADINFAKEQQIDFIVVGRPIYQAQNPSSVVEKILQNI